MGPAHFSISLEMRSLPVALPFLSLRRWERISVGGEVTLYGELCKLWGGVGGEMFCTGEGQMWVCLGIGGQGGIIIEGPEEGGKVVQFYILVRVVPLSVGLQVAMEVPPFSGGFGCGGMHFALKALIKLAGFGVEEMTV